MSRTVTTYVQNIFNVLSKGLNVSNVEKMRLRIPDAETLQRDIEIFLGASNLEVDYILNNVKIGKFSYGKDEYFLITQVDPNDPKTKTALDSLEAKGIVEQEINAGLFMFLVTDAKLEKTSPLSSAELEQNIFYDQYEGDYQGHDFSDLIKYFENFSVFKIEAGSAFIGREYTETGYFICSQFDKFIRLPIQSLVNNYFTILQEQSAVPKENVFLSLTATHYKHAFIELYRCIEVLYVMPRSLKLKARLAYANPAYELAVHCVSELGWRKQEEDSLCRILKDIDEAVIAASGIQGASFANPDWAFDGTDLSKKSHETLAAKIYKIRNQFVHQLNLNQETTIEDSDWIILIQFTLNVIKDAYRVYKSDLPPRFS